MTDAQLRGPLWTQVNQGLWSWSSTEPSAAQRIRRAVPLVGDLGAIGGWAAALVHGHHDLDGIGVDGAPMPVLVCRPRASRLRRVRDVRLFRSDLDDGEAMEVDGLRVTSPIRTCADLARLTQPLVEAVVAVDVMARDSPQILDDAAGWLAAHPRWVGVARARRALRLAAAGVRSPSETRLRLLWVLDAGLPQPVVNPLIVHRDGHALGEVDLFDPQSGLVAEYDGAHHATAEQRAVDHARREQLQRSGLRVVQHTSTDLRQSRRRAVSRLRQQYAEGLRRDRLLDLWRIA